MTAPVVLVQAHALGWSTPAIFGAHQIAPISRLDAMGLILLLQGREIVAIDKDAATIRTRSGKVLSFRRDTVDTREQRLVWSESEFPC